MGCSMGGRKKSVTTTRKTIIVAMPIWDSLALLWSLGWMKSRSEGRDRPRGPTSTFCRHLAPQAIFFTFVVYEIQFPLVFVLKIDVFLNKTIENHQKISPAAGFVL